MKAEMGQREHDAQGELIGPPVDEHFFIVQLFRRREIGCTGPHTKVAASQRTLPEVTHDAKIHDDRRSSSGPEHDIRRFQVAMYQFLGRDMRNRVDQGCTQIEHGITTEQARFEMIVESPTIHEFFDEKCVLLTLMSEVSKDNE